VSTSAGKKTKPKTAKPAAAAKRATPGKKAAPKKASAAARSGRAPAKAARPAKATQPAKAARPAKATRTAKAAAPAKAIRPAKAAGAAKAAGSAKVKARAAAAPAKSPSKHQTNQAARTPAKTIAKPIVRPSAKPAAKVVAPAPRPAAAVAVKVAPRAPVPAQAAPAAPTVPAGVVPRKSGRGASKYFVAQVQAPLPPPTSRFADRFAPPRPPTRQMTKVENDTPREKQKADPRLANAWKTKAGRELADAEVLAMPDSEYMNEKQIEFFRMKLEALKNDLLSNAGETTEHLREDTSIVPDPADRATIEEEHALELRTRDRERKLLKKISQSLARLESGDYGFCDETGEPIGLGRLIARPTATLSLEAQQRRELKQKMFGD